MAGTRKPGPVGVDPEEIFQWAEGVSTLRPPSFTCTTGVMSIPGPIGILAKAKKFSVVTEIDYEELYSHLADPVFEGKVVYMYLDTRGYVTVGVGNLVSSVAEAEKLPFVNTDTGNTATADEIETSFTTVSKMAYPHKPAYYKQKPSIELKDETIKSMAIKRLKGEFVPGLRRIFANFDRYPKPAKLALVDMIYNLGERGLQKFKKLIAAAEKGHWREAADDSHRASCREDRNIWTHKRFEEAAAENL